MSRRADLFHLLDIAEWAERVVREGVHQWQHERQHDARRVATFQMFRRDNPSVPTTARTAIGRCAGQIEKPLVKAFHERNYTGLSEEQLFQVTLEGDTTP